MLFFNGEAFNGEGKQGGRSLSDLALDRCLSSLRLDDRPDQAQTQADPATITTPVAVDSVEAPKHVRLIFGRDSRAVVFDRYRPETWSGSLGLNARLSCLPR